MQPANHRTPNGIRPDAGRGPGPAPSTRRAPAGRLRVALLCLAVLPRAWALRLGRRASRVRLPPVRPGPGLSPADAAFAQRCADRLARLSARAIGRRCFVRSYVLGSVLRRHGTAAMLNIGLRGLGPHGSITGHCWLTVADGRPWGEPEAAAAGYPHFMGEGGNGVRYWVGT